jgi:RNA polymerase sigma-70 factor (ECF subfamily)
MTDELLLAARRSDEDAFAALVTPFRPSLYLLCYRMLGSVHDAEDAVQDTLVRAWRGLSGFEGRSSLRTWLHTVATHVCLRELERRSRRVLPVDYGPASDPDDPLGKRLLESVWIEPLPNFVAADFAAADSRYEQKESVELAFVAALQHLPPLQRAVLIMRDVLAFSAAEVASSLQTTPAAVNSALQRARLIVDTKLPERSQQSSLRSIGDARVRELVERFVSAWERSDVAGVVAVLAKDVVMTMPPLSAWFDGRAAVGEFLGRRPLALRGWRVMAMTANAQPAAAHYLWDEKAQTFNAHSITVLGMRDGLITKLNAFLDPALVTLAGLPESLSRDQGRPGTP